MCRGEGTELVFISTRRERRLGRTPEQCVRNEFPCCVMCQVGGPVSIRQPHGRAQETEGGHVAVRGATPAAPSTRFLRVY